jgi:hypothetical protein
MVIAIASAGSWPKVSGRLIGFDVLPASWRHIKLNSLDAETAADGSFEFPRVPPGDYKIWVNAPSNMAITTFTNVRVAGRDISGIELHAVRIVHTTGRVLVEGGGPVPSFEVKMIGASVPETLELNVRADGQFESNIPEAEFRLSIDRLSPGYSVRSIRGSGIDLLKNAWKPSAANAELAITFAVSSPPPWKRVSGRVLGEIPKVPAVVVNTNQTATPAGLLGGGTGAAFGGPGSGPERILLQGTGSRQEILSAVLNEDGTFVFPQVLPGTYFIRLAPVSRYIQPTTLTIRDSDISGVELSTSMDPPR